MYKQIVYVLLLISLSFLFACNASSLEPENENVQPEYIRYQQGDGQYRDPIPVDPGREQNIFENQQLYQENEHTQRRNSLAQKKGSSSEAKGQNVNNRKQQVIKLTNEARSKNGVDPLTFDEELAEMAQKKSNDMEQNNYFSHTSPTYGSSFDMLKQYGVNYTKASENIAAGQETPKMVVDDWLNSEGHRRNMLDGEVTHIGIGYAPNGDYWTQLFIAK